MAEEFKESRRDALKKAAVFVIPTLVTFQTANLAVAASGSSPKVSVSGDFKSYSGPGQ